MDAHHHRHRHHDRARQKSADTKLHGPGDDKQEQKESSPPPAPPPPQSSSSSSSSSSSKQQQVTISPASPPSSSSSPSHEFSFTISLHSSNNPTTSTTTTTNDNKKSNRNDNKSKTPPPSFAIDLSPADEIFFHGHLLPLHLLSHLPVSPRSSTNSLESFTLPIRDLSSSDDTEKPTQDSHNKNSTTSSSTTTTTSSSSSQKTEPTTKGSSRNKSTSFSLFGLGKWRRGYEFREREDKEEPKRKMRFEVSHVLKRYMRMVRPLLFFRGRRRESSTSFQLRRQPYSFSGILSSGNNSNKDLRGGRRTGEYSAPASMRTSPSNSGLLVATATLPSSASDSTMEELQAAIQAAIAHCKNSIAAEDHKLKC